MVVDFSAPLWVVQRKLCERLPRHTRTSLIFFALAMSAAAQLPSVVKTPPPFLKPRPHQNKSPIHWGAALPEEQFLASSKQRIAMTS